MYIYFLMVSCYALSRLFLVLFLLELFPFPFLFCHTRLCWHIHIQKHMKLGIFSNDIWTQWAELGDPLDEIMNWTQPKVIESSDSMSQRPAKLLKWWTMMTNVYREVKTWNEFAENNHAKADAYPIMNLVCIRVPSINLRTRWLGWEWGKLLSHIHFEYHKMSFYTQFTLLFGEWVRLMVFARREIPPTYQIIWMSKHYVWDILCLFLYAARNKNTYRIWRLVRVWAMEANNQMHWLPWPKVCVFSFFFSVWNMLSKFSSVFVVDNNIHCIGKEKKTVPPRSAYFDFNGAEHYVVY